ncbi:hypothetical protein B5M43_003490 [Microbacterium sp. MEC084]|uniref:hypothetical protein n=1 Tax=unclassified Microbacterium TaxID=2609290 RepID=UPI0006F581BA|nr:MULTISPECIES: hypothetical protein [unclassified Microbacterium]KQZ11928.1 hypothetical protein ASD19_01315 [Microbacterium sp. Root53]MCD1267913.1 hypothetical protein [Microbacterium sp. MEC084]
MSQDQGQTHTGGADTTAPTTAEEAKQAAAETTGTARAEAEASGASAREEAAATVEEAKERAAEAAAKAEDELTDQAATGQHKVAEGLRTAGDKVGSLSQKEGVVGDLAGKASEGLKQASDWVSQRDPETMMTEAKSFAKRKPWVVAAIGAVALMVLNRLTRAATGGRKKR